MTSWKRPVKMRPVFFLSALWVLAAGAWPAAQAKADLVSVTSKLELIVDAVVATEGSALVPEAERDARDEELFELEDEVAYLRVKTRRGLRITAAEYSLLDRRLDRFMARMKTADASGPREGILAGVDLDTRLLGRGRVAGVDRCRNGGRGGASTVRFDRLDLPRGSVAVNLVVVGALDYGKTMVSGLSDATLDALVAVEGSLRSTASRDVELPPGTILRLRFDSPLALP